MASRMPRYSGRAARARVTPSFTANKNTCQCGYTPSFTANKNTCQCEYTLVHCKPEHLSVWTHPRSCKQEHLSVGIRPRSLQTRTPVSGDTPSFTANKNTCQWGYTLVHCKQEHLSVDTLSFTPTRKPLLKVLFCVQNCAFSERLAFQTTQDADFVTSLPSVPN